MAYNPNWGSSGSGGGYSPTWGSGGGVKTGTAGSPRKSDPVHDLGSSLVRLARTLPNLSASDRARVTGQIAKQSKGLPAVELQRVIASAPEDIQGVLRSQAATANTSHDAVDTVLSAGGDVLSKVFNTVSAPSRGVLSGLAEYYRQYEKEGRPFIPTDIDVGKVAEAAAAGFQNQRHDTPMSIAKEAGNIRAKQGESTAAFGTVGAPLPGSDLRKNPIGGGAVGNFVYDLGGQIATDPLTYLSFGLSGLAKAGIEGSVDVLGAARTAELVDKGATILSAEEKARLAKSLAPKVYEALLKGGRGGVKVAFPKLPTPRNLAEGHFLSAPRTVLPGPLRGLRASKIIEGTAGQTPEIRAAAQAAEAGAREASARASELHAAADLAETQGAEAGRVSALRAQAEQYDRAAQDAAERAAEVTGGASREATTVAEHLRDTPLGRAITKISQAGPVTTARGLFVQRAAVKTKLGEGVANALDAARVRYRGTYQSSVEDDVNTLLHAARETGVTNAELEHVIGPALDIGGAGAAAAIPDSLRPMYDALVKVRDRFTAAQVEAGVTHENALHLTDEYFPRIYTREYEALKGKKIPSLAPAVPGTANIERGSSGNLQRRVMDLESPVPEINAASVAEHGVPKFVANPLEAFSKRAVSANQDIASKQYVDDVLRITDRSGNPIMRKAKSGLERPPADTVEVTIPGAGRFFAPKEIAGEITKARDLLVNDEATQAFIRGLDKWMTLWKGYATVPLPFGLGFHERNAMGNVFNNWLANISPADPAYFHAQRLQRAISKGAKAGDVYKFLSPADRKLVEEARRSDVIGEGFFGVDLPKNINAPVNVPFRQASASEKAARVRTAANPLNPSNALISGGRKLGRSIEENARLAHFIAKLDETGSVAEAARSVRKYLFDYSDLTPAERQIFKRFMAFYTFTRKNLPLQLGALLQTPGKYSHLQAARVAAADQAPAPKGLYPSYLPELGGVPLPIGVSQGLSKVPGLRFDPKQQIVFAPDLPVTNATSFASPAVQLLASLPGVNKIPGAPKNPEGVSGAARDLLSQGISGGAPGALLAAIQAFGAEKDFFSGRPLQGRVAAPTYALPFAQNRVLNGKKQPTITTKSQYLTESLLPLLGKISSAAPQGDYEQEKAPRRRLSTFTGLRTYPLGPGTQRGEALRRNTLLASIMADLRARGIDIASSRTKKRKSTWAR